MPSPVIAYVALGSNLGDRAATLSAAVHDLAAAPGCLVRRVSAWIETAPVGPGPQGPYLNAAAELATTLPPRGLLDLLLHIERTHGRDRAASWRWGPRTLDLDLLLFGSQIIDEPGLTVPHPRLHERPFVLAPLAEIAPAVIVPGLGARVADLLAALPGPQS